MSGGLWEVKREQIKNFLDRVDQLDEKKVLLSIFGISLIIRLLYVVFLPTIAVGDEIAYDRLAIGLIEGKGYGGGTSSYMPPGQPFFLAAIYYVFGYNPQIACIFQAFISSLTCIIIYYIGKSVLNKKIGIISGFIAAFYPTFIIFSELLITETLFVFLLTLSALYLLKIHEKTSAKNISITGVSLGLAMFMRPLIMGLIPFILIWMLLSSKNRKKNLMKFMVIILIMMAVISPWTVRNYNVHHEFVPVSLNGGYCFWLGNNPDATGMACSALENKTRAYTTLNMTAHNEVERDRLFYKKGFEFIKENPINVLCLDLEKFAYFLGIPNKFFANYFENRFINPIPKWLFIILAPLTVLPYIILLPFAIFGIVFYQKWDRKAYLLILLIFYYTLMHSLILAEVRYHLQIMPFLIIFATYGACSINRVQSEIRSGYPKTKRKMIIFFLLTAVLIASWYYSTYYWLSKIMILIGKFIGD